MNRSNTSCRYFCNKSSHFRSYMAHCHIPCPPTIWGKQTKPLELSGNLFLIGVLFHKGSQNYYSDISTYFSLSTSLFIFQKSRLRRSFLWQSLDFHRLCGFFWNYEGKYFLIQGNSPPWSMGKKHTVVPHNINPAWSWEHETNGGGAAWSESSLRASLITFNLLVNKNAAKLPSKIYWISSADRPT